MAKPKGGLTKWFKEKWVDIGRPKKKENINLVVEEKQKLVVEDTQNASL
jgi:hypothetical protein